MLKTIAQFNIETRRLHVWGYKGLAQANNLISSLGDHMQSFLFDIIRSAHAVCATHNN